MGLVTAQRADAGQSLRQTSPLRLHTRPDQQEAISTQMLHTVGVKTLSLAHAIILGRFLLKILRL